MDRGISDYVPENVIHAVLAAFTTREIYSLQDGRMFLTEMPPESTIIPTAILPVECPQALETRAKERLIGVFERHCSIH